MPILSTALTLDNGVIVSQQLLMLEASVPESLFQFRVASVSDSESHVLVTRKNQASDSDEVVSYRLSDGYKTEYSLPYLGTHGSVDTRIQLRTKILHYLAMFIKIRSKFRYFRFRFLCFFIILF